MWRTPWERISMTAEETTARFIYTGSMKMPVPTVWNLLLTYPIPVSYPTLPCTESRTTGSSTAACLWSFGEYDAQGTLIREYAYECTMQNYRTIKYDFTGILVCINGKLNYSKGKGNTMETEVKLSDLLDIVSLAKATCIDREHSLKIKEKGFGNYVTEVDMNVQRFIEGKLKELAPGIQFMGEEKNNDDIDFTKPVWILDPVDGTSNLIHDLQNSVISLALYSGRELVMGVVCHLFADETFYAEKGEGGLPERTAHPCQRGG